MRQRFQKIESFRTSISQVLDMSLEVQLIVKDQTKELRFLNNRNFVSIKIKFQIQMK
jgi:hypothetical protein